MAAAVPNEVQAVAELRASLEEAADALAHAHLDRLLACESRIEHALRQVPTRGLSPDGRRAVTAEVDLVRHALMRCRRLGAALDEFIRLGMAAQGIGHGYGRQAPLTPDLHSLNTTV
jgi:hypothetical protein